MKQHLHPFCSYFCSAQADLRHRHMSDDVGFSPFTGTGHRLADCGAEEASSAPSSSGYHRLRDPVAELESCKTIVAAFQVTVADDPDAETLLTDITDYLTQITILLSETDAHGKNRRLTAEVSDLMRIRFSELRDRVSRKRYVVDIDGDDADDAGDAPTQNFDEDAAMLSVDRELHEQGAMATGEASLDVRKSGRKLATQAGASRSRPDKRRRVHTQTEEIE